MTGRPPEDRPIPPQPPPPGPTEDRGAEEGLLETAVSVITNPVVTLARITAEARLGWAVAVVIVIGILSGLVTGASFSATPTPVPPDPAFPDGLPSGFGVALAILAAVLTPIFSLLGLLIGTAILHGTSLLLKGRGSFRGLFCGLAFAQIPYLLGIPVQLLPLGLGEAGFVLSGLVGFLLALWVIILAVVAVRENNDFSTGRAVAAVLIPVAVIVVLLFLLIFAVVLLVAGAFMEAIP